MTYLPTPKYKALSLTTIPQAHRPQCRSPIHHLRKACHDPQKTYIRQILPLFSRKKLPRIIFGHLPTEVLIGKKKPLVSGLCMQRHVGLDGVVSNQGVCRDGKSVRILERVALLPVELICEIGEVDFEELWSMGEC